LAEFLSEENGTSPNSDKSLVGLEGGTEVVAIGHAIEDSDSIIGAFGEVRVQGPAAGGKGAAAALGCNPANVALHLLPVLPGTFGNT
jgi:hypothetical protein